VTPLRTSKKEYNITAVASASQGLCGRSFQTGMLIKILAQGISVKLLDKIVHPYVTCKIISSVNYSSVFGIW